MGSEYRALITQSLEPLHNRVEILFAESRLECGSGDQHQAVEDVQLMTLLVSFDPQAPQRLSARALAATFIAAQCGFRQLPIGHDLDIWLNSFLAERAPASLCIVVSLPEYSTVTSQQVSKLLKGLKTTSHHHLNLIVAVCSSSLDWGQCDGIDKFVQADAPHRESAALHVFSMMAALMAPGMSHCFDADDLRQVLGSSAHPAQVASGVFHSDELKTSAEVLSKLEASSSVAFMPVAPMYLGAQHALLQSVRKLTNPDSELVIMTPYSMQSIPLFMDEVVLVSLLVGGHPMPVTAK